MKRLSVVVLSVALMLIAGMAVAQNLVMDPGFDGTPTYYSTLNTNTAEWFDVFIMGEPGLPWTSCNRFWFQNITYGWTAVANNRLREGKTYYTPTDLAPDATGTIENVGGIFGDWNGEASFFQNISVQPGHTYRFSGYYWGQGANEDTQSQIWVNTNGGFQKYINTSWGRFGGANPREQMGIAGDVNTLVGATQIVNIATLPLPSETASWTAFSYDFVAGSDAVGLAARVIVGGAAPYNTNHSWYTDNWSLTEVVPEPSGLIALSLGMFGLIGVIRRRK